MKLKDVYAGCTKDKKERVLQKRFLGHDGCSYTGYIDLKTNEVFTSMDIDTESLVPYTKIIPNKKYSFKRKIVKSFKSDTKLFYHVDNLFLGNLYRVDWIPNSVAPNLFMDVTFKKCNRIFVKICETEFRDLRSGKIYKKLGDDTLNIGDICVSDLKNANQLLELSYDGTLVSKQYVLRKYYQKYSKR